MRASFLANALTAVAAIAIESVPRAATGETPKPMNRILNRYNPRRRQGMSKDADGLEPLVLDDLGLLATLS